MNQLHIIGRFTAEPDIREFSNEGGANTCANFTLAVPGRKKDAPADFFKCTAWGSAAELIGKYGHKGEKLAVSGSISFFSYTNPDGAQIYTHSVTVEHFEFMSAPRNPRNPHNLQRPTGVDADNRRPFRPPLFHSEV